VSPWRGGLEGLTKKAESAETDGCGGRDSLARDGGSGGARLSEG